MGGVRVPRTAEEVAALEARYEPFAPAAAWADVTCDTARWQRHADALADAVQSADPERWAQLRERFYRAAALDSAALAELIRPVPDLTAVVLRSSVSGADWTSVVEANRLVVECHRRALTVAAAAAEKGISVDESLIAQLQDLIVESQQTYTVTIEDGSRAEVDMPKRQYKPVSNYLVSAVPDAGLVPFAPAGRVAEEMARLSTEFASDEFAALHPVVQSAYAHISLQRVHPFADGNGRLCRTLASMPLLREAGLPQLILADQWPAYLQAVGLAQQGEPGPLVELFLAVQVNTIALARDLLDLPADATTAPDIQVRDTAEQMLRDLVRTHLKTAIGSDNGARFRVAAAAVHVEGETDGWLRAVATTGDTLEVRADDVHPVPLEIVHLRVRSWLDRVLLKGPSLPSVRGLFVLGVPRSGTTLMGNWIGSHPDVLGLAEYAGFYVAHSVAPRYVNPLPGREHEGFLAELAHLPADHLSDLAHQRSCAWFCDATPWNLEVAGALASSMRDAVFVLMLRHFSGAVLSLRQFDWSGKTWEDAAQLWVNLNAHITRLPVDRTIVVSYDVLAEEPAETVAGVRDALGSLGLAPGGFDDTQLAASHAHIIGKPRPTIVELIDGQLVFRAIPSLDAKRWTAEVHARVWPVVKDMHAALADQFPNVYVAPPRPAHVPENEW